VARSAPGAVTPLASPAVRFETWRCSFQLNSKISRLRSDIFDQLQSYSSLHDSSKGHREMILRVIAIESIEPLALVSLLFNDSNPIFCRKSLASEPPDAIAKRPIAYGESVTFDSGQNTNDLLRPHTKHYEAYPPWWLVTK
jgi:hypothetical protein